MDISMLDATDEVFLIQKAKLSGDPSAAKAWILTAKTLYPQNFTVQYEAYSLEKNALNHEEAANCLSYMVVTFRTPPEPLWSEIAQLTDALRSAPPATDPQPSPSQPPSTPTTSTISAAPPSASAAFYLRLFPHIPLDVQQQILAHHAARPDNSALEHARLCLATIRRFPATAATHAPRLLDTLMQGLRLAATTSAAQAIREIIITEALPLLQSPTESEVAYPAQLVHSLLATAFEYHVNAMFAGDPAATAAAAADSSQPHIQEHWSRLLATLRRCGQQLGWEAFPVYEAGRSADYYWKGVCQIVAAAPPRPSENKQILFCATTVFVMALQSYMRHVRPSRPGGLDFVLVEGFQAPLSAQSTEMAGLGAARIAATSEPCTAETAACLVTASNCWQLLHSNEILQADFAQLLRAVPMAAWIAAFLVDLAFYMGSVEEARGVVAEANIAPVERNLRMLSLVASAPQPNIAALFECLLKALTELPAGTPRGDWATELASSIPGATGVRHMILLPLSRRAIVQYCTAVLVRELRAKLLADPAACSDSLLGNVLVLLQLDWPAEYQLAEQVMDVITARRQFTYLPFQQYVIQVDLIEQFMAMWYPHGGDVRLHFALRSPQAAITAVGEYEDGGEAAAGGAVGGGGGGGAAAASGAARRIGMRGADKTGGEEVKLMMRQQIARCGEPIDDCVERFIVAEHVQLMHNLYEK